MVVNIQDFGCKHELEHNHNKDIVFCKLCGDRWEKEQQSLIGGGTTTTPFYTTCGTTGGCLYENLRKNTDGTFPTTGLVCNCPKCGAR